MRTEMGLTLEEILAFLALYGKPSLFRMTDGWYSSLEVLVSGSGVQFKITSESNHRTPREAAECCKDRLEEALRALRSPGPSQPTLGVARGGPAAPDAITGGPR
jgi:hypothetical protein